MAAKGLEEELAFVKKATGHDDATILSAAVRRGVRSLYREALTGAYLEGRVTREIVMREFGPEFADRVDRERKVVEEDIAWGVSG